MDVGDWLRSLGLGQYEAAFLENEIDRDLLKNLTVEDLKDLGVAIVGHRRQMLLAIKELSGSPTASTAQAETAVAPPERTQPNVAERRQLTVMFCDLVGSTALAARLVLDAEKMQLGLPLSRARSLQTKCRLGGRLLLRTAQIKHNASFVSLLTVRAEISEDLV
jgi:hypothetical protein